MNTARPDQVLRWHKSRHFVSKVLVFGLLLGLALIKTSAAQKNQPFEVPTNPFPRPTGPFAVGTHEYLWIDQNRGEPFAENKTDRRHVLVRVWYPAQPQRDVEPALYIRDVNEFAEDSESRKLQKVKTNAVTDAPFANSKEPFPLLMYQPGGGNPRFVATFETEQLASYGYIVVAEDHAGFNETVLYPDGYRVKSFMQLAPKPKGILREDALANWDFLSKEVFPTWTADGSYVLDKLTELNRTPGDLFYQKIDLTRIGMFGWSFGGATSMQMSRDDARVKAVVDQDGQLFGDVRDKGTGRPFMLMHHGLPEVPPTPKDADTMKELVAMVDQWDRSLLAHSTNDWYQVTIAKTEHGSFSDLTLFGPNPPDHLDPQRTHDIIATYTLAFFDKYLRGRDSDLLKAPSAKYPEVTFSKKQ